MEFFKGNYSNKCCKCGKIFHEADKLWFVCQDCCKADDLTNTMTNAVVSALEGVEPTEQDKSVMIKLTPEEVFNLVKMGAKYWANALKNNTHLSLEEVCRHHFEMSIGILKATDPDRFIYSS